MRRLLTGGMALWLAMAGLFALVPGAAAAGSVFAGTWVSIDGDGSTQMVAIGGSSTPAVTYQDFYASSCDTGGAPSTHFVATGRGIVDGSTLWVDFRNGGCGRAKIGPFGLAYSYDAGTDTLTDDFGITWSRFP